MIDGGRNKAGVRKRLLDIVMANKGTAPAVRHDDKRELVAADRATFHPRHGDGAEIGLARRCGAG